jgi:hypothetical protein
VSDDGQPAAEADFASGLMVKFILKIGGFMSNTPRVKNPKQNGSSREQRQKRTQRIIVSVFAVILIISWILSLVVNI